MWFILYKEVVPGSQRYGSPIGGVAGYTCEFVEHSKVIDIHPLLWMKANPRDILLDWKKLTDEDVAAFKRD